MGTATSSRANWDSDAANRLKQGQVSRTHVCFSWSATLARQLRLFGGLLEEI